MTERSEESLQDIERERKILSKKYVDELSDDEYEIFLAVLRIESENRHLQRPRGVKQKLEQVIERTIK